MKEIINKVKRKSTEREKIFANHKSDKGSDPNILVKSEYTTQNIQRTSTTQHFKKQGQLKK